MFQEALTSLGCGFHFLESDIPSFPPFRCKDSEFFQSE
jgi:hypothetical protein